MHPGFLSPLTAHKHCFCLLKKKRGGGGYPTCNTRGFTLCLSWWVPSFGEVSGSLPITSPMQRARGLANLRWKMARPLRQQATQPRGPSCTAPLSQSRSPAAKDSESIFSQWFRSSSAPQQGTVLSRTRRKPYRALSNEKNAVICLLKIQLV